jgi:hypothetical protein
VSAKKPFGTESIPINMIQKLPIATDSGVFRGHAIESWHTPLDPLTKIKLQKEIELCRLIKIVNVIQTDSSQGSLQRLLV